MCSLDWMEAHLMEDVLLWDANIPTEILALIDEQVLVLEEQILDNFNQNVTYGFGGSGVSRVCVGNSNNRYINDSAVGGIFPTSAKRDMEEQMMRVSYLDSFKSPPIWPGKSIMKAKLNQGLKVGLDKPFVCLAAGIFGNRA